MSLTIWKAVLNSKYEQEIQVPVGAELLCAREQGDQACIWYRCNPDNIKDWRKIIFAVTGSSAPEGGRFLGTVSLMGGRLIFHVFEA